MRVYDAHNAYAEISAFIMRKAKPAKESRNRNIRWEISVDQIAEDLAHEKRLKGGVSELLARLILAESKRKRGIAHLHEPTPSELPARSIKPKKGSRSGATSLLKAD
jgi:hypothetical protein